MSSTEHQVTSPPACCFGSCTLLKTLTATSSNPFRFPRSTVPYAPAAHHMESGCWCTERSHLHCVSAWDVLRPRCAVDLRQQVCCQKSASDHVNAATAVKHMQSCTFQQQLHRAGLDSTKQSLPCRSWGCWRALLHCTKDQAPQIAQCHPHLGPGAKAAHPVA